MEKGSPNHAARPKSRAVQTTKNVSVVSNRAARPATTAPAPAKSTAATPRAPHCPGEIQISSKRNAPTTKTKFAGLKKWRPSHRKRNFDPTAAKAARNMISTLDVRSSSVSDNAVIHGLSGSNRHPCHWRPSHSAQKAPRSANDTPEGSILKSKSCIPNPMRHVRTNT